jgi:ribosome-associated translation inhibitor RaiA/cold shock CspA family protein
MQEPLQIAFHNMDRSDAIDARVRERVAKLERLHDGIISCRIVIDAPHRQPHKGSLGITISIGVPGKEIAVKREQKLHESDQHATWVINEAFDAAERQLDDYARIRRRDVKVHESGSQYARVVRLYPDQEYGFIETPEHVNLYFHRAVVRDDKFADLSEGSEVLYTLADDEGPMGPMASSVWLVSGEHPAR